MHFHFLTLFPETIEVWLRTSILGRAHEQGIFQYSLYQLRDFAENKHRRVDDVAYGGGGGMVLCVEPLVRAVETIQSRIAPEKARVIYFTPAGLRLSTQILKQFLPPSSSNHIILVCGHYEGVDQRFIEGWVDDEISLGDFVLTGGELPAVAFTDALIRHLPEVLGYESAVHEESFSLQESGRPLLEYPHYTRPAEFLGRRVPEALLSGNHERIADWRRQKSEERTERRRPDLSRI